MLEPTDALSTTLQEIVIVAWLKIWLSIVSIPIYYLKHELNLLTVFTEMEHHAQPGEPI